MGTLEKKWALNLQASAKIGDISAALADVLHKLRPTVSATIRHALAIEITAKVSLLLCDQNVHLNQSVLGAFCQIVSECCRAAGHFEDEAQMYSFLCSLYHSVKVFLQKKMIKEVLELRGHIINLKVKDTKLSEKIALTMRQISALYIKEILDPLREAYGRNCNDESYFSLMNVLDDIVDLLLCGGIHNLQMALNYSVSISRLKSNHVTEKSYMRLEVHLMKSVRLGDMFRTSSCKLIPNAPELCREYLFAMYVIAHHSLEKNDFSKLKEALSRLDQVSTFFEPNQNLCNIVKFYKHFSNAFIGILDEGEPTEIKKGFELSFKALASITQQSDVDETTFKVMLKTCDNTSRLVKSVFSKLREKSCEWWNSRMSIGLLSSINKVILEMDNVIDGNGHSDCQSSDKLFCPMKSSCKFDVSLMVVVSKLIVISLQNEMADVALLLPQAAIAQKTCLKNVETLKTLGCVQWKTQWITVARVSYNLAYFCTKSDFKHHKNGFLSDLLDAFLLVEDLASPALTCFSLWDCVTHLFDSYKLLGKLRYALVTLVVAMAAIPDKKKEIFLLWLSVKRDKLAKKLPDVSLWNIYNKEKAGLHSKYSLNFAKHLVRDEIAVLEIEALCCTSLEECAASVEDWISALAKLDVDESWRTRAEVALLKRTWTVDATPSEAVLQRARARVEDMPSDLTEENRQLGFILVELAFWVFLCQLKADRNRMKVQMDRGSEHRVPTQVEHLRRGTDELVPAYCHLDIGNETSLLEALATALTIAHWLVDGTAPAEFKGSPACWDKLRNMVEVSARIFESFGYEHRALGCWGLLGKLAALMDDRPTALLALGHLLAELDHDAAGSLLAKGDLLAESLSAEDPKRETQEIVVSYHLGKSAGCLNNGRYTEGKQALKKALSLLAAWPTEDTILHAQARLVTSKYQLLPAGLLGVSDLGDDSPHLSMLRALATVKQLSRIRGVHKQESSIISARHQHSLGHSSQIMAVFFDVALSYARLCVRQGFAREFEISTPNLMVALQRQALALRTAQLLSALANMDLVCQIPNCQVKINAMENITLLGKTVDRVKMARKAQNTVTKTPPRLQLPRNAALGRDFLPQTPIFKPIPFSAPDFTAHPEACGCVYCKSPEIQTVALDIVSLQAWFYSLQGNSNQAVEYFKGAVLVHSHLFKKQSIIFDRLAETMPHYFNESSRFPLKNGSWKGSLFRIKFLADLSFVDFHVRHDLVEKAAEMNRSLAAALESFPLVKGLLYPEVLHQQICCTSRSNSKNSMIGSACVTHLVQDVRKSTGQVVAETPRGPTKILCSKTAPKPFNVFLDRCLKVVPKVLDMKTPSPTANPPQKPAMSSVTILQQLIKECGDPAPEDFIEPSPEPPSTQRKAWTGSRLTKNRLGPAMKADSRVKADAESDSPAMHEARKQLLFNIEEESTESAHLKQSIKKTKQAMEIDAPKKPQRPVKTATSRARVRPQPAGEIGALLDASAASEKGESLPERRGRKQAEQQLHDLEYVKVGRAKARVASKSSKSATSTEGAHTGLKTAPNGNGDDVTQVTNLLGKVKIDDDEMREPAKSRVKTQECRVPAAPTKSKKVLQPSAASKFSERVTQVTEMVKQITVEEHRDKAAKPPVRQTRAKPLLTKPKIKVSGSSSSSSGSSKVKVKLENVFRSPLKAGLENAADLGSPVATRRVRRARQ